MSQLSTAAAGNPAGQAASGPAVFKVLGDGTVLYRSPQQVEAAGGQRSAGPCAGAAKQLAQARYGEKYQGKDGQPALCTLEGLMEFQATGFVFVMVAMAALWLACSALHRLVSSLERSAAGEARPADPPPARPVAACGMHPGLTDQQLIVLLTAAASEMLSGPVRIEKVRLLNSGDSNWATQGRSVLHSHLLK